MSCDTRSPGDARRFCASELGALLTSRPERGQVLDDATLIVSELVTNSLNAGCTDIRLDLSIHRHQLRIGVWDDAPGHPVWRVPGPEEIHGRGLTITASLSTAWGVQTTDPGKWVWAELALPPTLTRALSCDS